MLLSEQLSSEIEMIYANGYDAGKVCRLAGICRKTLWNARYKPETITLYTADKIIHAIKKIPTLPFEFKKKPTGD
jgi:hypothetical protein